MKNVVFLLLRRLRTPLVLLTVVYAVTVLGFVLIPGVDNHGQPWRMDFFHAFYVVSYTATTIGFGELPYAFNDAQRMWLIVTIYATVITWVYSIGAMLTTVQDPTFRTILTENAFGRAVRNMAEPFYLICGYGDTGAMLVRALAVSGIQPVVIDIDQERANALELEDLPLVVPGLRGDAALPTVLLLAGLKHPLCQGVIALTDNDEVNLKIAITAKLLKPGLAAICRSESDDIARNMASFGTDHTIDAFQTFAGRLAMAIHSPGLYLLFEWMTAAPHEPLREPIFPPRGRWILCGYGRFGKAVHARLAREGVEVTIIEADPDRTDPPEGSVIGRGTEADTLLEAGITNAIGIVAGTDNDANNLSIVMTAHALNEDLFMVARQNEQENAGLFQAARVDLIMRRSGVIAHKIFALLTTPLLTEFLELSRKQGNDWANQLVSRIGGIVGERAPETWGLAITPADAPAIYAGLSDHTVTVSDLWRDPRNRDERLPGLALLLKRGTMEIITPDGATPLERGDRLLLAGRIEAHRQLSWIARNHNSFAYLVTGRERSTGWLWERFSRGQKQA
ncbi:MAG: NAD-binding protein [Pseudomonadota bacterium]